MENGSGKCESESDPSKLLCESFDFDESILDVSRGIPAIKAVSGSIGIESLYRDNQENSCNNQANCQNREDALISIILWAVQKLDQKLDQHFDDLNKIIDQKFDEQKIQNLGKNVTHCNTSLNNLNKIYDEPINVEIKTKVINKEEPQIIDLEEDKGCRESENNIKNNELNLDNIKTNLKQEVKEEGDNVLESKNNVSNYYWDIPVNYFLNKTFVISIKNQSDFFNVSENYCLNKIFECPNKNIFALWNFHDDFV